MRARNVIVSLIFVILLLGYIFIKVRWLEPRKKLNFNRNPSRIEYTNYAICRMDCFSINANTVADLFRKGEVKKPAVKNEDQREPDITPKHADTIDHVATSNPAKQ